MGRRSRRRKKRQLKKQGLYYRKNREIRSKKVRVVGDDIGNRIVSKTRALKMAKKRDLDLVEVAPKAKPPVCKIMDYNKFIYKKKKKKKKSKKKAAKTEIKEIRFTPHTEEHDFNFKTEHAKKFLSNGAKVKAYVQFKGRAIVFKDQGREMLYSFAKELEDYGKLENEPKMEGRRMLVTITPISQKKN